MALHPGGLPEERQASTSSPVSSTPRSRSLGFVENPFEIGSNASEVHFPRAGKSAPSAATIDELEELDTSDVIAATQRILEDLVINPFELIPGASDMAVPAWNPEALNVLGPKGYNNSPMMLDFLHRESERNLGRLVNNVSNIRDTAWSPSGRPCADASVACEAPEERNTPEARPLGALVAVHERAHPGRRHSTASTPRCLETVGQAPCEFTPPPARRLQDTPRSVGSDHGVQAAYEQGLRLSTPPAQVTAPSAALPWAPIRRDRAAAFQLQVGVHSLAGRKVHCQTGWMNQDMALTLPLGPSRLLVGVFDGHGEHGVEMASVARDLFSQHARDLLGDDSSSGMNRSRLGVPDALRRMFLLAQEALERGGRAEWSGTTATVALIDTDNSSITCAHAGDSRLAVTSGPKVLFETVDHSVDALTECRINASGGEVRQMTVSGVTASRIFLRGQGLPGLSMSRSLGDAKVHAVGVLAEPSIQASVEFAPGSTLIVASDGVWEKVSTAEAAAVSSLAGADPEAVAINLAVEARSRWLQNGGDVDDITAVIVHAAALDLPRANGKP